MENDANADGFSGDQAGDPLASPSGGATTTTAAEAAASQQLKRFIDSIGTIVTLVKHYRERDADRNQRETYARLAFEEVICARYVWEGLLKQGQYDWNTVRPEPSLIPVLVVYLHRVENLISEHWPVEVRQPALEVLAGVFVHATTALTAWLTDKPTEGRDWGTHKLTWNGARQRVRGSLSRWACAVEGRGSGFPAAFQTSVRRAIASETLPAILDAFDRGVLSEFLTCISNRVFDLAKEPNGSESANFIEETANVFWDAAILHRRVRRDTSYIVDSTRGLLANLNK